MDEHERSDPQVKDMLTQIKALEALLAQSRDAGPGGALFDGAGSAWQLYRRLMLGYVAQVQRAEMRMREVAYEELGVGAFRTEFPVAISHLMIALEGTF